MLIRLGPALARLRRRAGELQKDIAEKAGISESQVSRYERGRDVPRVVTLVKYLHTVGASFADLGVELKDSKSDVDARR